MCKPWTSVRLNNFTSITVETQIVGIVEEDDCCIYLTVFHIDATDCIPQATQQIDRDLEIFSEKEKTV